MTRSYVISCLLGIFLTLTSSTPQILANSLEDLQDEKEALENDKVRLNSGVEKKEIEIDLNQSTIDTMLNQLQSLDKTIDSANKKIGQTESEFYQTAEENELLYTSISLLEKDVAEREYVIRNRIRAIQVNEGTVAFLDVLFGSTGIADFISRYSTLSTLLEADRKIMKQQYSDIKQLEDKKSLVAHNLSKQRDNRQSLQELYALLELQRIEKVDVVQELEDEQVILGSEKEKLKNSYVEAAKKSSEIEQDIIALQKRQTTFSNLKKSFITYTSPAVCSADGEINNNMFFAQFEAAGEFTGKGQVFIDVANEYHIDPVLMAAIALHETGSGTSNAIRNYNNPGGLMNPATNWSTLLRFDTLEDGLRSTGRTLNKLINKGGLTTISALGSVYAPLGANNDPTGLNGHWAPNVTKFTNELGGLIVNCKNS